MKRLKRLEARASDLIEREKQEKLNNLFGSWTTEELKTFIAYEEGNISSISDDLKRKIAEVQEQYEMIRSDRYSGK